MAALCRSDPSFLVKNCVRPEILERLRVDSNRSDLGDEIVISPEVQDDIVKEFVQVIQSKYFMLFKYEIFKNPSFCQEVLEKAIGKTVQGCEFDVNTKNEDGETLLHVTTRYQCKAAVEILLQYEADLDLCTKRNRTALHTLCQGEPVDVSLIEMLVEKGIALNSQDFAQKTALHYLCDRQTIDMKAVCVLVGHGADVMLTNIFEKMPLHVACKTATNLNDVKLQSLFGDKGDAPSACDRNRKTALHYLCQRDVLQLQAIDDLISNGADVNAEDVDHYSPFHYICLHEKAGVEVIELFIQNGANIKGNPYMTPLHALCKRTQIDLKCLKILLEKGADVNTVNSEKTPLHLLCERFSRTSAESLKFIVLRGADTKKMDATFKTALHYLISSDGCNEDVVNFLLDHGADSEVNAMDSNEETPLHKCVLKETVDENILSTLLTHGANVNLEGPKNNTPFHIVCLKEEIDIHAMSQLLPQCDVNKPGELNRTPLHMLCATENVNKEALEVLFKCKDLDTDAVDEVGFTPLQYLCMNSAMESVEKVITARNINLSLVRDMKHEENRGQTALHLACITAKPEPQIVKELLNHKANIWSTDSRGRTPLHFICQRPRRFVLSCRIMEWSMSEKDQIIENDDLKRLRLEIAKLVLNKQKARARKADHDPQPTSSGYSTDSNMEGDEKGNEKRSFVINKEYCNMTDNYGRTALHYLCMRDSTVIDASLYQTLIKGTDTERSDAFGLTVLHYLVLNGAADLIQSLCVRQGDKNKAVVHTDIQYPGILPGMTSLHLACITSKADVTVVRMLLNQGVDINKTDCKKRTALYYICEDPQCFTVNHTTNDISVSDHVEEKGINRCDIQDKRFQIMKILLHHERHKVDTEGVPALHGKFKDLYEGERL